MKSIHTTTLGKPRRWLALGLVALGLVGAVAPATAQRHARQKKVTVVSHERSRAPRLGSRAAALPNGHVRLTLRGTTYYYHAGVFYRPANGSFVVVSAPVGARVATLPLEARVVRVGSITYRYYQGVFYRWMPGIGMFEVVRAPVGAEVTYPPPGATAQLIGGAQAYVHAGVRYRPVIRDGVTFCLVTSF